MSVSKQHQVADPERTVQPLSEEVKAVDAKLAKDPDNAQLWMERGLALSGQSLMREAVEAYSRAIALDPFNGVLYRHRGHRHLSCWQFEDAAADFATAARLLPADHPETWNVWYHLGLAWYLMGEYGKAEQAYRKCYAITNPADLINFCPITDWLWRTEMRLGKTEEAKALIAALPADFDIEMEPCGYSRVCAMYQGRVKPEELIEGRMLPERLDAMTMVYALSNYYHVMGNEARSNELIEETLNFGDAEWWCAFGYLAAMQDKKARTAASQKDHSLIQRFDTAHGLDRLVVHNGVAWFTGHSARPGYSTLEEQTQAVVNRYDELFAQFGLKKKNILSFNAYLTDIENIEEFNRVFYPWLEKDGCSAAGVCVEAKPAGKDNLLELQLMVAVDSL